MPFFDHDDVRLYYRLWEVDEPSAGLVFLHGGGEHSGQFSRLASRLNAEGINVWAIDHRGHGISGGERGAVPSFEPLVADAAALVDRIRAGFPELPLVIGGHSLGGWTSALLVVRDPSAYAGAILTGASLRRVAVLERSSKTKFVFDTSLLATDPAYLEELEKDPLVQLTLPPIDPSVFETAARELKDGLPQVQIPLLFINGTNDRLASIEDARHWHDTLATARLIEVQDGVHNVLNDVDYRATGAAVARFVREVTTGIPAGAAQ